MNLKVPQRILGIGIVGMSLGIMQLDAQMNSTQKADIGFTLLQAELGAGMPTGAGISVTQVEAANGSGHYRPNTSDSQLTGKTYVFPSGGSTTALTHATTVARYFYGSSSLAPGIGVSPEQVAVYNANGFLVGDFLRLGDSSQLPKVEVNDIQNHSWIFTFDTVAVNVEAIQRMDYAIQRDGFVGVFGLNNLSSTVVPALLGSTYNGIVVGRSDGNHSVGGTLVDGVGRLKPDIVAPTTATSWAAPSVGGAAALLLQTARETSGLGAADDPRVIKSILMTGASRSGEEFTWSNSSTQPLDAVYGAGELDIYNSYHLLTAGQGVASSSATVAAVGWDQNTVGMTVPQVYFFDLDSPQTLTQMAAVLTWYRDVDAEDTQPGPGINYVFNASLADLNLRLFEADGFTLGAELSSSVSAIDNVELIRTGGLAPGRYAWQVTSNTNGVDYGFSWRIESVESIPEPRLAFMMSSGLVVFLLSRKRRRYDD